MLIVAFHEYVVITFKDNREMLGHFVLKCQTCQPFKMLKTQLQADHAKHLDKARRKIKSTEWLWEILYHDPLKH